MGKTCEFGIFTPPESQFTSGAADCGSGCGLGRSGDRLIEQLPQVQFWKVGLELFVSSGPAILSLLKQRQKRVFLDLKFHDIPNTVAGACGAAAAFGVDLLTIHATAGRTALQAAQAALQHGSTAAGHSPPALIAITLLTSLSARDLAFDLQVPLELPEYALQMALLAQGAGLAGVVCSPLEAAQLRQVCGEDFLLVCPGGAAPGRGNWGSAAIAHPWSGDPGGSQLPGDRSAHYDSSPASGHLCANLSGNRRPLADL